MDKPRHPQVIRTWKTERLNKQAGRRQVQGTRRKDRNPRQK